MNDVRGIEKRKNTVPRPERVSKATLLEQLADERTELEATIAERSRRMLELSGKGKFEEVERSSEEIAELQSKLSELTEDIDRLTEEQESLKKAVRTGELSEGETTSLEENLAWVHGESKKFEELGPDLKKSMDWIEDQEKARVEAEELSEMLEPIDELDENLMWVEEEARKRAEDQIRRKADADESAKAYEALGMTPEEPDDEPEAQTPLLDENSLQRKKNDERLHRIEKGDQEKEGLASIEGKLKKMGIDMAKAESSTFERAKLRARTMFNAELRKLVDDYRARVKERDYFTKRAEIYKDES